MTPEDGLFEVIREAFSLRAPAQSTELIQFMGLVGICQRSQIGRLEPAIGVRSGNMDIAGGNNQHSALGDLGKWVDFFALADAKGTASEKEKGHVGAEGCGDFDQARRGDFFTSELQIAEKRGGGIARASTKSTACGYFLLQGEFDAGAQ